MGIQQHDTRVAHVYSHRCIAWMGTCNSSQFIKSESRSSEGYSFDSQRWQGTFDSTSILQLSMTDETDPRYHTTSIKLILHTQTAGQGALKECEIPQVIVNDCG